nr:methyltransferase domain-containing protein [Colletotrichum truncatum]KAF6796043.1 methyltransferase domain-containing protein [Colletotrichum truncatum]
MESKREMDRLDMVHHLWMLTWDGDICLSPKKKTAKRVLDLGTGTGIWALDYADEHPEATVLGVDLSAIQPEYVPPNCSFEVDDIEKEWTWTTPFDFIFLRYMIGSFTDWNNIFTKAYDHLEPGGYIEIQDIDFPLRCDDGTMKEGWQPLKWGEMLIEASEKIGRPGHMTPKFEQMLLDIGFVDVVVRRAKWPFNPWPKDKHLKELGMWCQAGSLAGIEAASLRLFTQVLDWTPEETTVLCAEVRKEHMKMNVHAYYDVYAIYGRKPEKEASEAPAA